MVVKINVGSGDNYLEGYVNIDAQASKNPDVVVDALLYIKELEDNSVDEILAEQFVEHLSPADAHVFVVASRRVLKPGGKLIIECPDIAKVAIAFAERRTPFWRLLQSCFGGEGGANTNYGHKWGYSSASMRGLLLETFNEVLESNTMSSPSSVAERDFHFEAIKKGFHLEATK